MSLPFAWELAICAAELHPTMTMILPRDQQKIRI